MKALDGPSLSRYVVSAPGIATAGSCSGAWGSFQEFLKNPSGSFWLNSSEVDLDSPGWSLSTSNPPPLWLRHASSFILLQWGRLVPSRSPWGNIPLCKWCCLALVSGMPHWPKGRHVHLCLANHCLRVVDSQCRPFSSPPRQADLAAHLSHPLSLCWALLVVLLKLLSRWD